jgi:hypothetical protein
MSTDAQAVPTDGTAGEINADAEETLTALAEAAQAAEDGDKGEAKDLQEDALELLEDFYDDHAG